MPAAACVPWLAKSWAWTNGNKTLTLNLQKGVKWSDGKLLTSADVVYSLTAGFQDKSMDMIGLTGADNNVLSIKPSGAYKVVIKLKSVDSQFIAAILNLQFVVPKHIWANVSDPRHVHEPGPRSAQATFASLGRFTTRTTSSTEQALLAQGCTEDRVPQYTSAASNDAALLQIQSGQVDWTHNFVPDVAHAYISKDPAHYHAFMRRRPLISLVFDTTVYPYSIVAFRKA
jgi:peptide/nickel transport system substrate-binding protein